MKKEITLVSNYYPPEKGAAANRIEQLAIKLQENGYVVTVICPLPNYPEGKVFKSYQGKVFATEKINHISVKRLWVYPDNSKNPFKRFLSMFSFSFVLFFYLLFFKTTHKIIIQSPPLLISFCGVLASKIRFKTVILNVSDLWPLAGVELEALKKGSLAHKIMLFLERFIYSKADVILGQSHEIIEHIKNIFPNKSCHLYRNYPDHGKIVLEPKTENRNPTIKIFYAGLLGVAQGVYEVCKNLKIEQLPIEFHIYGDGAEKNQIQAFIQNNPNCKIFFYGMVERKVLQEKIKEFDIAFVPLKIRLFGSVPSKIFEYSLLGFPILYYGGGEGEDIVNENEIGWVGKVGNFDSLNHHLKKLSLLSYEEINKLKIKTLNNAENNFSIDKQIKHLINENVF